MNTNFNPDEYYVLRTDYSSEHIPMLAWENTSRRKFLESEEIKGMETPLEIGFYDPAPKKPQMNDILELGSSYVISEKIKQLLEKAGLPKLQFFSTIIKKKKESYTGYYILHCYNSIAAIDKNNYEGDPVDEDDGQIYDLKRFALDAEVLNKVALHNRLFFCFAENNSYIIVHQSIVDAIKEAGITGVIFYAVSSWLPKLETLKSDEVEPKKDDSSGDWDDEEEEDWGDDEDGNDDSDDSDDEMERIYELASEKDEFIPEFIEVQREKGNRGFTQVEHITDVLSSTDNGLRLLAFCCVYGVDNQALETCIPDWVKEYVGKDKDRQEKLFKYMLLEVSKTGKKQYSASFIAEALQAVGVNIDKTALNKMLDTIKENELPTLASVINK